MHGLESEQENLKQNSLSDRQPVQLVGYDDQFEKNWKSIPI